MPPDPFRRKPKIAAQSAASKQEVLDAQQFAIALACLADDKKADNIVIYHVAPLIGIADYFVVVSGANALQIKAMAKDCERVGKATGNRPVGREGVADAGWILVDFADVVLHLFDHATRDYYDFDLLWGDAERLDWQSA